MRSSLIVVERSAAQLPVALVQLSRACASRIRRGETFENHVRSRLHTSLRAKRSNPDFLRGEILDCFGARAPRNDGSAPGRMRRKTDLVNPFKLICLVQSLAEKYYCFVLSEGVVLYPQPASSKRDVRVVTIREVGSGSRERQCWTSIVRRGREIAWSWRPDAGAKSLGMMNPKGDGG